MPEAGADSPTVHRQARTAGRNSSGSGRPAAPRPADAATVFPRRRAAPRHARQHSRECVRDCARISSARTPSVRPATGSARHPAGETIPTTPAPRARRGRYRPCIHPLPQHSHPCSFRSTSSDLPDPPGSLSSGPSNPQKTLGRPLSLTVSGPGTVPARRNTAAHAFIPAG